MSLIKTPPEIEALKEGGVILSRVLREIREACAVGVTTKDLDALARKRFDEAGGNPSFLGYRITPKDPAYPGALCVSINDEVVHGLAIPPRALKEGDVVGLDIGMWYKGLCTDMATTVIVGSGQSHPKLHRLVADTRESLIRALEAIRAGAWVSDIGAAVEDYLKPKGYGIVKDLVGHGVGHAVHEEPSIPNYREPRAAKVQLKAGMVLAIEPMVTLGSWKVKMKPDGWTIVTADGSVAAHFEVTVVVTDKGYELITPWPDA
ncbi:MAG TPA: type I methionyl aminopeptidase [Candidatus Methylomirabilis sp.]|nr:type I methionyl aminopeptidase [Candidatus Methylomirabilis sp.]